MKQLLILSGKGGTGKTTLAGAFIKLGEIKAYSDCDVDAPNLHLLYDLSQAPEGSGAGQAPGESQSRPATDQAPGESQSRPATDQAPRESQSRPVTGETNTDTGTAGPAARIQTDDFYGMDKALIDQGKCDGCDLCRTHCRFDAIFIDPNKGHTVDDFACEGCGVCEYVCPMDAITMIPAVAGELQLYKNDQRVFSTAKLKMGSGNSGLLVTEVKNRMKNSALPDTDVAILDGSPGIGCPVIASVSGVDMVLIVAEPSIAGISDMERIVKTAEQLEVSIAICVNKGDTNPEGTAEIEDFCRREKLAFVGSIPYDPKVIRAVNLGKTAVDDPGPAAEAIKAVYEKTIKLLAVD